MNLELTTYVICFLTSLIASGAIVFWTPKPAKCGGSWDSGPQQLHLGMVPRIGGIAIVGSLVLNVIFFENNYTTLLALLVLSAAPVFFAGFIEDCISPVSPSIRLIVSLISGLIFCWITGYKITNVNLVPLNLVLEIPAISFLLTALAVAAMANALNIVDGLNGLASACGILMIASFCFLSFNAGDYELSFVCLMVIFTLAGFLFWNFPFGKIFLGDGGAYFLGAMVGGIAVLLPERNDSISPFSSLLIVIYPFYELVRSMFRRIFSSDGRAFEPDDRHLHSLIFKLLAARYSIRRTYTNSIASLLSLILPIICCFYAVIFAKESLLLCIGVMIFVVLYEAVLKELRKSIL